MHQVDEVAELTKQLAVRDQKLEAAAAEIVALRGAVAEQDKRLAASTQQFAELQQQVRHLQQSLQGLCSVVPTRAHPLPILQHILRRLHYLVPPSNTSLFPFLLNLPDTALQHIAQSVGLVMRQVCKHLRDAYGPLLRLQPAPLGDFNTELMAMLQRPSMLQHLTSLNLFGRGSVTNNDTLKLAVSCCSQLVKLSCICPLESAASAIVDPLATLHRTLRELDLRCLPELTMRDLQCIGRLTALQALMCTLSSSNKGVSFAQPLGSLQLLTKLVDYKGGPQSPAFPLLELAQQLPLLQHLKLPDPLVWNTPSLDILRTLSTLTALDPGSTDVKFGQPLVEAIAALSNLRWLSMGYAEIWAAPYMSRLKCLRLQSLEAAAGDGCIDPDAVLGAIGGWQSLTQLRLHGDMVLEEHDIVTLRWLASMLSDLHLGVTTVPHTLFSLLSGFPRLQQLSLEFISVWIESGLASEPTAVLAVPAGLSSLTRLSALSIEMHNEGITAATVEEVGHLTGLTRLRLCSEGMRQEDVWQLLPLQRLQVLMAGELEAGAAACAALQCLPALQG